MLNLNEIKEGMRVVVVGGCESEFISFGEKGTIKWCSEGWHIVFDEYNSVRHNCGGYCEEGHGYWLMNYNSVYFDLISEFKAGDKVVVTKEKFINEGKMTYDDFLDCEIGRKQSKQGYLKVGDMRDGKVYVYGMEHNYKFSPKELEYYIEPKSEPIKVKVGDKAIFYNHTCTDIPLSLDTELEVFDMDEEYIQLVKRSDKVTLAIEVKVEDFNECFKLANPQWTKWGYLDNGTLWRQRGNEVEVKSRGIKARARCVDGDEFDLATGQRIALLKLENKLAEKEIEKNNKKLAELIK